MFFVCNEATVIEFKGLKRGELRFFVVYRKVVGVFVLTGTI